MADTDYGVDLAWIDADGTGVFDLDPSFSLVTGQRALALSLLRRLQTRRGSLPWAPGEGIDVRGFLNSSLDRAGVAQMKLAIVAELLKDERVFGATVDPVFDFTAGTMQLAIGVESAEGPFRLVLGVSAVTVALLRGTETT